MFRIISKKNYDILKKDKRIKCANEMVEMVEYCIDNDIAYSLYSRNVNISQPRKPSNGVWIEGDYYSDINSIKDLRALFEAVTDLDKAKNTLMKAAGTYE